MNRRLFHMGITVSLLSSLSACGDGRASLPTSGSTLKAASPTLKAVASRMFTYTDSNVPPAGWQFPYSANPFTVRACISDPCSPTLDAASASEIAGVVAGGTLDLGDIFEGYPGTNTFPVFYASSSDPTYTVTCDHGGCGKGSPIIVQIPNGAYASDGSDHHLTVVNLSKGTETDFWEFNDGGTGTGTVKPVSGGGKLSSGSAGVCTTSSFAGNVAACANSATGSALPVQPIALDPREVIGGSINHVVYATVGCAQKAFVFPARGSDGYCPSGPKYGSRIWLDLTDAKINALPDAAWAKTMLHAMHHYGWIVADSNGGTGIALTPISAQSFTLWGITNPWSAFWKAAKPGDTFVTIPTTGISRSNIHILAPCVNSQNC